MVFRRHSLYLGLRLCVFRPTPQLIANPLQLINRLPSPTIGLIALRQIPINAKPAPISQNLPINNHPYMFLLLIILLIRPLLAKLRLLIASLLLLRAFVLEFDLDEALGLVGEFEGVLDGDEHFEDVVDEYDVYLEEGVDFLFEVG